MSMKKISELQLETTANYQTKSNLNVRFWNQDLNTAELRFLITRDSFPLSLSIENVKVIIVLEQGNNFISSEDFEISSEVDGVASFLIPSDFMSAVSGEVTGQVYVGTLDSDEVIVQRKFTFQVENDLLSSIPSELKLQYIKTFSDLADNTSARLFQIEEDMAAMEDHVAAVNQATTDGLNALNNLVNAKTVEYNDNHADKLALINSTVDGYVQDFLNQRSYIDTKYAEFQAAVTGSEIVKDTDAESWQKYKLTTDNGNQIQLTGIDFNTIDETLKPGFYWVSGGTNRPVNINGFLTVRQGTGSNSYIKVVFEPFNSNVIYVRTKDGSSGWSNWEEIAIQNSNDPFETVTNSQNKANVAENNAKQYTDSRHKVLFDGNVSGVNSTIKLEDDYTQYSLLVISGDFPGGEWTKPHLVANTISIHVTEINLTDNEASGGGIYELLIQKTDARTLTIGLDNYMEITSNTGYTNADKFTVQRIEGWK